MIYLKWLVEGIFILLCIIALFFMTTDWDYVVLIFMPFLIPLAIMQVFINWMVFHRDDYNDKIKGGV